MRLTRERAIADDTTGDPGRAFQPGLFDRRAERVRLALEADAADEAAEAAQRIAALEQAAAVHVAAPELLLVLAP